VKTQIWIAVSIYLLVAIVRKRLGLRASLYQILQILSVTLFEKVPILQALEASSSQYELLEDPNQLILFNSSWTPITWVLIENSRNLLRAAGEINGIP
jgi:hypothetical protein